MNKVMDGFLWFLSKGILLCGFCSYCAMFKLEEAKEKRKTEQSDNSSDVYYLGSLCFVKVSEMVKKVCFARFSFVPQQDGAFQWMAAAMVTWYLHVIFLLSRSVIAAPYITSRHWNLLLFQCTLLCVQLLTRGSSYPQILLLRGPDFSLPRMISLYPP